MNHKEFLKYHRQCIEKMSATVDKKNKDYAGQGADAFTNFKFIEEVGVCPATHGFMVRKADKFMRVVNFIKSGVLNVSEETIEDTLLDEANYNILLAAYIKDMRASQQKSIEEPAKLMKALEEMKVEMDKKEIAESLLRVDPVVQEPVKVDPVIEEVKPERPRLVVW